MNFGITRLERIATCTLAAATVIVGASIVADGTLAKGLNGVSGLAWFASSAMFVIEGRRRGAPVIQWAGTLALTAAVAFLIRPSDLLLATVGFGGAGVAAGLLSNKNPMFWAKMIPAIYLPLHIGTAVLKAVGRSVLGMETSSRTDPPPTAAVVPVVMLVAAIAGGWVVGRIRGSRSELPGSPASSVNDVGG